MSNHPKRPLCWSMLDTIREYGLDVLEAGGEANAVGGRHARYYTRLAEEAEPRLLTPLDRDNWFARLDRVEDNIRAALGWSLGAAAWPTSTLPPVAGGIEAFQRIQAASRQFSRERRRRHASITPQPVVGARPLPGRASLCAARRSRPSGR